MTDGTVFAAWIAAYEERCGGPAATLGRCKEAAEEMAAAFPGELRVVRGHVDCPEPWGRRAHWWCELVESPTRAIVDPTRGQFPFVDFLIDYEEYEEGEPVRRGTCTDCGEAIWAPPEDDTVDTDFCDARCRDAYAAYLNSGAL